MKKVILLLAALFLIPIFALAEASVALNETAVFSDMPCSWAQGYEPRIEGNTLILHVPVNASGVSRVSVAIMADFPEISPLKTQGVSVNGVREASGLYTATIKAALLRGRTNGDYRCKLVITGTTNAGKAIVREYPFTLHIRDGQPPTIAPRPVITDVAASLTLGESGTLTLHLTNPSPHADLSGLTLKVTDPTGDILPSGTDTLLLSDIPAGGSAAISVPLTVRPTASVSLHPLRFDLSWTALGNSGTWQETFTLPVTQEIRLEQGGVSLAPTILQGELATLTLPLMNMGRGELRNVLVTLELSDLISRQSVLVGTLPAGETKQARLTFTPGKAAEGTYSGTITVTAEDAYGNETSFMLPVETTVEKAPELNITVPPLEEQRGLPGLTIGLAGGCVALMIACLLQGLILRRKIRTLEEARL